MPFAPGDTEQFAALYEETFAPVYRYACILMGDPTRAEDLAAEVYLRAWRARAQYRARGSALSWLLSITHNTAVNMHMTDKRYVQAPLALDAEPDPGVSPEEAAIAADLAHPIRVAILQLTPDQQQVIVLRFLEDLSVTEVAARLGRQPEAVRALQYRAMRQLRRILPSDEGAPPRNGDAGTEQLVVPGHLWGAKT